MATGATIDYVKKRVITRGPADAGGDPVVDIWGSITFKKAGVSSVDLTLDLSDDLADVGFVSINPVGKFQFAYDHSSVSGDISITTGGAGATFGTGNEGSVLGGTSVAFFARGS